MSIEQWAVKWAVPPQAIQELRAVLSGPVVCPAPGVARSEAWVQSAVRLDAARSGVWLTRNNVGVLIDQTGRPVRYGLANESKQQNQVVKSADLIGIKRLHITADMVGSTIGQFVSRECKRSDWKWSGNARELAQARWRDFINSYGGDAAIVNATGSFNAAHDVQP